MSRILALAVALAVAVLAFASGVSADGLPAQCKSKIGMSQGQCTALRTYWLKSTAPCGTVAKGVNPVVWIGNSCAADRTVSHGRTNGCRIQGDCSTGCADTCKRAPWCQWQGGMCVPKPVTL